MLFLILSKGPYLAFYSFQSSFPWALSLDPTDLAEGAGQLIDKEMRLRNLSQWTKDTGLRIGPGALPLVQTLSVMVTMFSELPPHF